RPELMAKLARIHQQGARPQTFRLERQEAQRCHECLVRHGHLAPLQFENAHVWMMHDAAPLVTGHLAGHRSPLDAGAGSRRRQSVGTWYTSSIRHTDVTKFQHRTIDPRVERVEAAMGLIGSRWRPAIMFSLIMRGTQRFSELRRLIPGVSQRMLTKQLRDLERHGLVRRQFFESGPPPVEYSATELGKRLHPTYKPGCDWAGDKWRDVTKAGQRYDRAAKPGRPPTHGEARTQSVGVHRPASASRSSGSS